MVSLVQPVQTIQVTSRQRVTITHCIPILSDQHQTLNGGTTSIVAWSRASGVLTTGSESGSDGACVV